MDSTLRHLRKRLCGLNSNVELMGLEKEFSTLKDVVWRTAAHGESNSLLIVGPRGTGKSLLLEKVLDEVTQDTDVADNLIQIHLSGFLQTDDRVALKEITRQMKLEAAVQDKTFMSFAENLQYLLETLHAGGRSTKAVLFVLEEFDMLAAHRNQSLLYNLLDAAQSQQAPLCVVGLSARLDVLDLLEKRVRSRFSGRMIHLLPSLTLAQYTDTAAVLLTLPKGATEENTLRHWNGGVKRLVSSPSVVSVLEARHCVDTGIAALKQLLFQVVSGVDPKEGQLKSGHFTDAGQLLATDSDTSVLQDTTILELCLVVAALHLTDIYDGEPFNFEMLYREYRKAVQMRSTLPHFERPIVLKAFEHLVEQEMFRPTDNFVSNRVSLIHRPLAVAVLPSQLSHALHKRADCPSDMKQWANSGIQD